MSIDPMAGARGADVIDISDAGQYAGRYRLHSAASTIGGNASTRRPMDGHDLHRNPLPPSYMGVGARSVTDFHDGAQMMQTRTAASVFAGLGILGDYLSPLAQQARSTGWQQSTYLCLKVLQWLKGQQGRDDLNAAQRGYVDQSVQQWQNEWMQNQQMAALEISQDRGMLQAGQELIGQDMGPWRSGLDEGLHRRHHNQLAANINAYANASQSTNDAGAQLSQQVAQQNAADAAALRHGTNYTLPDGTVIQFLPEDMEGEDPATIHWNNVTAPPPLTPQQTPTAQANRRRNSSSSKSAHADGIDCPGSGGRKHSGSGSSVRKRGSGSANTGNGGNRHGFSKQ